MFTEQNNQYFGTCINLEKQIREHDFRIRTTSANQAAKEEHLQRIERFRTLITLLDALSEKIKPLMTDIQEYITSRRESSLQNINNAIRMTSEIVQDAADGVKFVLEDDEAYIATFDGLDVQDVEGGGYRNTLSAFLRSVVLRSDPEFLQTIFFDEAFAEVSGANSATLSTYLNVLVQDQQIISIEQKPEVASNVPHITYLFEKDNDYTTVTKVPMEES